MSEKAIKSEIVGNYKIELIRFFGFPVSEEEMMDRLNNSYRVDVYKINKNLFGTKNLEHVDRFLATKKNFDKRFEYAVKLAKEELGG